MAGRGSEHMKNTCVLTIKSRVTRPGNERGYVTKYGIARPRVIENGISATKTSSTARINKYLKRPETLSWNI